MYCKKCKYHSFDHISACPKCGTDWEETRKALYLNWLTSSGYNWLTADALTPKQAQQKTAETAAPLVPPTPSASLPDAEGIFLDVDTLIPPTPPVPNINMEDGLDVGLLPELDFALEAPTPPAPSAPPVTIEPEAAIEIDSDIYLDDLEPLHIPTPEPIAVPEVQDQSARSISKREDLFIPELEEMLAPLTDELASNQPNAAVKFDQEDDIVLDFGPTQDDDVIVINDTEELDILSLDEPKK